MKLNLPRFNSVLITVPIMALIAGIGLLLYGRWSEPVVEAARAIEAREPERALNAYAVGAERFHDLSVTQQLLAGDFARLTHNQLALLYQTGKYDEVLETAEAAPPGAAPHFWMGCALFAKGRQEQEPDARLEWLRRAADEFKLALADTPDDWDTKYNYELTARLVAALRDKPKKAPQSLIRLLRPDTQEKRQATPVKKTG